MVHQELDQWKTVHVRCLDEIIEPTLRPRILPFLSFPLDEGRISIPKKGSILGLKLQCDQIDSRPALRPRILPFLGIDIRPSSRGKLKTNSQLSMAMLT
jgi:hypothetical protein